MTLHLLRLDPAPEAAARWFAAEGLLPKGGEDDGYGWHALLAAVFGKEQAPKPFCVNARRGRPLQILAYTQRNPAALEQAARDYADPLALQAAGLASAGLAAKPMPAFEAGRRLGFSVKVRPIVRTDRDGDRRRSAEIDAYVAALRAGDGTGERPDRAAVYCRWTQEKLAAGGAAVLDLRVRGVDQVPVVRRDAVRRLKPVQGHAASLAGVLEVSDAERFAHLLARGVGRHRAFGYGMLLLAPV